MKSDIRRKEIAAILLSEKKPVSGDTLAKRMQVSRQIIVNDIAMLRESGYEITSVHKGYVLNKSPLLERVFKVRHLKSQTGKELTLIVDLGGTVADVFVYHEIYGKISASLNIFSHHHIEQFLNNLKSGKSIELMSITDGFHYHTIRAESTEILDMIEKRLLEEGFLIQENI